MISSQAMAQFFMQIQTHICQHLGQINQQDFISDAWNNQQNYGLTNIVKQGLVFEQAGVNFSHVKGEALPIAATKKRPELAGSPFEAMGVSLVIHPNNPYVPTSHANIRFFIAYPKNQDPVWWFGGGFDLTPFYPEMDDVIHWHQVAHDLCQPYGETVYPQYKKWCDNYFYIPHRQEARGVGGIFFDDLNHWSFDTCKQFVADVAQGFLDAYTPIVNKHKDRAFGERERQFQLYRRGRYVEFNLVWDRGTLFGLQSNGRIESILMSMPPLVRFEYQYTVDTNSNEAKLQDFLHARDWLQNTKN